MDLKLYSPIDRDYKFLNKWAKTYPFEIHELLVSYSTNNNFDLISAWAYNAIDKSNFFNGTFLTPYLTKINPFHFKTIDRDSSHLIKVNTVLKDKIELYISRKKGGISFRIYNKEKELILM